MNHEGTSSRLQTWQGFLSFLLSCPFLTLVLHLMPSATRIFRSYLQSKGKETPKSGHYSSTDDGPASLCPCLALSASAFEEKKHQSGHTAPLLCLFFLSHRHKRLTRFAQASIGEGERGREAKWILSLISRPPPPLQSSLLVTKAWLGLLSLPPSWQTMPSPRLG